MATRAFLGAVMLGFICIGCTPAIVYIDKPEYGHDEASARAWQAQLNAELNGAKLSIKRHTTPLPDGWQPVLTFIHTADAQIRDANILYRSKGTSKIIDLFASGTER